jgi:hypothetical protein
MESSGKTEGEKEKEAIEGEGAHEGHAEEDIPVDIELPPASFHSLVIMLATSALGYLSEIGKADPRQKKLLSKLARHTVDMIMVLDEKTKGNQTEDEKLLISRTLADLRLQFIKHAELS